MTRTERWTIESPRFGTIEVEASSLIEFDGLPGFPDLRRFAVFQHDRESAFGWLQSIEQPEVAFPIIDPRPWFPEYRPALRAAVLHALEAEATEPIEWLAIATAREGSVTLNLAAPLLINPRNRRGVQAILEGDEWTTREPLAPPQVPAPSQTESKPQMNSGHGSTVDSDRT